MVFLADHGPGVKIPKAAEIIVWKIKHRIIRHDLKEGELLPPEMKLMAEFGVSRPTIREAFRILETERLVTVTRGARGGAVVHRPDCSLITSHMLLRLAWERDTVADIYEARITFEPAVVHRVAELASEKAPVILQPLLDQAFAHKEDSDRVAGILTEFFSQMIQLADNHLLQFMYLTVEEVVRRHQAIAMSQAKRTKTPAQSTLDTQVFLNSYQKLLKLIAESRGDEAEAHWRRHISYVRKTWVNDYNMLISELFPEYN